MAENYPINGSAAYDIYRVQETTAIPLKRPKRLPDAAVYNPPKKRVRAKPEVALLAIVGVVMAAVLLMVALFRYSEMYELKTQVAALEQTKAELAKEQDHLNAIYENSLDLEEIRERALELGMHPPRDSQITYVEVGTQAAEDALVQRDK